MLRDLQLLPVYRSDSSNIVEDFYIPALSCAQRYDRAVGFFSASMVSLAAQGLSAFIKNGGQMRLVVSCELSPEEADAIHSGYALREVAQRHIAAFFDNTLDLPSLLFQNRLRALSWMIASNRLDVKIAFKQIGMYHEKIGIIHDGEDTIVFHGSANESAFALSQDYNFESINVFPTWKSELSGYTEPYIDGFERLWNNTTKNVSIIDFPEAAKHFFFKLAREYQPSFINDEIYLSKPKIEITVEPAEPKTPSHINNKPFSLFKHQREALNNWRNQGGEGLFELATGAGKTITALHCAVKIFEKSKKLFLVIAVPYQNLADQWADEASNFGIYPVKCYHSKNQWIDRANATISEFASGQRKFACFLAVNKTLSSQAFQDLLPKIDGEYLFFVGDECHHHASPTMIKSLPNQARFRIGLSATLDTCESDNYKTLSGYYGKIVSTYTLEDALRDRVLTPYYYYIHCVDLTKDETERYIELSMKIKKAFAIDKESEQLKALLLSRSRLIGAASEKLSSLQNVLTSKGKHALTLFYCGDGTTECSMSDEEDRQIILTTKLLYDLGWKSSRFTSYESKENRKAILDCFKNKAIDALVAIRCLDEGIDIPACSTAYILASSTSSRQHIQRRGRILRRAEGKESATIHDFFVRLPPTQDNADLEKNLIKRELDRIREFSRLAINKDECLITLSSILAQNGLDYLAYSQER